MHTPKQGQKDVIKQLFKMAHILVNTKVLSVELSWIALKIFSSDSIS